MAMERRELPLTDLGVPRGTAMVLWRGGIRTAEELLAASDEALLALPTIGPGKALALRRSAAAVPALRSQVRDLVVARYLAGDSTAHLCVEFGFVPETILDWVRRAGHQPRRAGPSPTPIDGERLRAVREVRAGTPVRVVAERYGVTGQTVRSWVRKAGLSPQRAQAERRRQAKERAAVCPSCGMTYSLRLDGTFRRHRGRAGRGGYCPGSNRPPADG